MNLYSRRKSKINGSIQQAISFTTAQNKFLKIMCRVLDMLL